jgi:hypothetical protein
VYGFFDPLQKKVTISSIEPGPLANHKGSSRLGFMLLLETIEKQMAVAM